MIDALDQPEELDAVLAALAHAVRRDILLAVWCHGGAMSAGAIAARFAHSWPTTSRHLGVLEQAGLLAFEKQGRSRLYRLSQARLQIVHDWLRWLRNAPAAPEAGPTAAPATVVRNIALAYPEVREDVHAQERTLLVRNRPFLLLRAEGDGWDVRVRLTQSRERALAQPFVEAVRYRLGKSDWIVARFTERDDVPLDLLWQWIDESYRAAAPKRLLAEVPGPPGIRPDAGGAGPRGGAS